jgi:hypothetical protein
MRCNIISKCGKDSFMFQNSFLIKIPLFILAALCLNFLVLTCESDSCILQFLNELNLTYQRLTHFVVSFYFIRIVLVPWGTFPLCHTPIRHISAFWDQISILIVGCMTT